MLKADLHIHSAYSMDCGTPLEKIIERCLEVGINCIAIADHGTAEGALKAKSMAPFPVIVAEEILTPHGEIMGMFLNETIPSGLSVDETLARIRQQGALVCTPHPFDSVTRAGLNSRVLSQIADQIDVVEVFNARSPLHFTSKKSLAFARKHNIPGSAGSDAHTLGEIGNAYVEMPEFEDKLSFLKSLAQGKIYGKRSSPLVHIATTWNKLKKQF